MGNNKCAHNKLPKDSDAETPETMMNDLHKATNTFRFHCWGPLWPKNTRAESRRLIPPLSNNNKQQASVSAWAPLHDCYQRQIPAYPMGMLMAVPGPLYPGLAPNPKVAIGNLEADARVASP